MTLYVLLGLSWFLVGLAFLVLWLAREGEPAARWRLLLVAAATPFVLFPLASVCRLAIEQVATLVPINVSVTGVLVYLILYQLDPS